MMIREVFILLYLTLFKALFYLFRLFPLNHDKIICVTAFGDNTQQIIEHLQETNKKIIILKDAHCTVDFRELVFHKAFKLTSKSPVSFVSSIFHLATSKVIFADNYFGFLAVTNFKPDVKVVQLWHAAGAVKKFGLKDPSNSHRSRRANERFRSVYKRFDHVVVGSDKMTPIFMESFGLSESHMLTTGIPRTDFFFQQDRVKNTQVELQKQYPIIKEKKVILYAPTFRENELESPQIHLDFNRMFEKLRKEYVLLLKLHPAVASNYTVHLPSFVVDVSSYKNINHLLTITDILITDYSSIPVEFSLLHKPMIFYPYDLESYEKERGFWEPYEESMPGPIAYSTEDIINIIMKDNFDMEEVTSYAKEWNKYSNGNSTRNLLQTLNIG